MNEFGDSPAIEEFLRRPHGKSTRLKFFDPWELKKQMSEDAEQGRSLWGGLARQIPPVIDVLRFPAMNHFNVFDTPELSRRTQARSMVSALLGLSGEISDMHSIDLFASFGTESNRNYTHGTLAEALNDGTDWDPRVVRSLAYTAVKPALDNPQQWILETHREEQIERQSNINRQLVSSLIQS